MTAAAGDHRQLVLDVARFTLSRNGGLASLAPIVKPGNPVRRVPLALQ